jgi:YD repeat-containing protein
MPRPTGTQTRTFTYSGHKLLTANNPENGTVTLTYNSYNKVANRTDAKGAAVVYTYDSLARLIEAQKYPTGTGGAEDTCQREIYSYDSNPYNSGFSQYAAGRLTALQYYGGYNNGSTNCNTTFTEMYNYSQPGAKLAKLLQVTRTVSGAASSVNLEADYTVR